MKLKILIGVLVTLIIVNIAAVDTYLYYNLANRPGDNPDNMSPGVPASGGEQGDDPLAKLNDTQRKEIRTLMQEFKRSTGELYGRIKVLDDDILTLIQQEPSQKEKIEQDLKEISTLRMEISKIAVEKIMQTKSYLSKEQQEKLFSAIFRTKSKVQSQGKGNDQQQDRDLNTDTGPRQDQRDIPPPPMNRLKKYTEKLELTTEQIAKIDAILRLSQNKYSSLELKKSSDPSEYGKQRKEIMDQEDAQVEKILNETQKRKFAELKKKQDRRGVKVDQNELPPQD
jgi:Spy/CpxP family protein refolding chaperone